ncbi:hypothetical protein BP1258A_3392 [Burkholderia pseudomallei 1258a]|uniref:Uncharacterized protein n=1 Tax=Burkholderia pseudomallei (strain 1026b) TaxID=884204 RepID=A0A0H3HSQ6_BURP2|nr:hypothetical protein BP1026B_II0624 [Burkholderia pseudomallei 1026b]EIF59970.1 hypothetical protein BP1258A_3392 [Burkholderia pseudomallei 1258a]EIF60494.1 hypothetical protein BP1258B_3768 [Burkholderia pseudomallei 1258b]EIF61441.1 hypothetical protein BP1026A_2302 [Burkholderia pseudomallei 1026a]
MSAKRTLRQAAESCAKDCDGSAHAAASAAPNTNVVVDFMVASLFDGLRRRFRLNRAACTVGSKVTGQIRGEATDGDLFLPVCDYT